jgi:DNA polymerase III delta prime subunit
MDSNNIQPLLSELLRPQCLADLNLPDNIMQSLQNMIKNQAPMNLLFYGEPGIGKTSAARIIIKEIAGDNNCYELNGSFNNGDKTMIKQIESFASTISLYGGPKICFIDEADHLSKDAQASLRYTIEKMSTNTRFIMTANEFKRLTKAMLSRCTPICFDVSPLEANKVIDRMVSRYVTRLSELGYENDPKKIRDITCFYYPDLRSIANQFQLELRYLN